MSHDQHRQLEAAARHIFAGREPCEFDYMRVVPSHHRTPPLPRRCRICGLPVGKGRQTTCGPECAKTIERIAFWSAMCRAAWERDEHRCQECGKALESEWRGDLYPAGATFHHAIEVNEGGGQLGLDNVQTLCVPCHDAKTAAYAAQRAAARRAALQAALPPSPQLELAL